MHARTRKIFASALAVVLIALGIFAVIALTSPEPTSPQVPVAGAEQYAPPAEINLPLVQLEGSWRAEYNGTVFVAKVASEIIEIDLQSADGSTMKYWYGTFKSSESAGQSVTSNIVDTQEIVLSQAKSKVFAVEKHSLSFEFKAMGVTKVVELKRG
jgi:hypothetical protein